MHRQQSLDQIGEQLKNIAHAIKHEGVSLAESLAMVEAASILMQKMERQYFGKKLSVVQVKQTSATQTQEIPFQP